MLFYSLFQVRSFSSSAWFGTNYETDEAKLRAKIDPGLRLGDYPVLPWRSAQLEKPTGWWDNQDRRNKETPVGDLIDGRHTCTHLRYFVDVHAC